MVTLKCLITPLPTPLRQAHLLSSGVFGLVMKRSRGGERTLTNGLVRLLKGNLWGTTIERSVFKDTRHRNETQPQCKGNYKM